MTAKSPISHRLRVAHLNHRGANPIDLAPDQDTRAAIAEELGLIALPALTMQAQIVARGNDAWALEGHLNARVVQPCVVTLEPVETTIDEDIRRIFTPHLNTPDDEEVEMPDDELEPLGQFIDAGAVMVEALSLALPLYPRAEGVELAESPADALPEPDEDRQKPFAGLDALLSRKSQ